MEIFGKKIKLISLLFEQKNINYERIAQDINDSLMEKIIKDEKIKEFIETNSFRLNIFSIFIKRKLGEKK